MKKLLSSEESTRHACIYIYIVIQVCLMNVLIKLECERQMMVISLLFENQS